jgi:hypothetical protein
MPHGVLNSWVYCDLECGSKAAALPSATHDPLNPHQGFRDIPQIEGLFSGLALPPNLLRINTPTPPTSVDSKGFRELLSPLDSTLTKKLGGCHFPSSQDPPSREPRAFPLAVED